MVRQAWPEAIIITPGIRSSDADHHEQKRVSTPYQAILDGADYIVCGREIIQQPTEALMIRRVHRINADVNRALIARNKSK